MADAPPDRASARARRRSLLLRAPSPWGMVAFIVVLSAGLAALIRSPAVGSAPYLAVLLALFLGPAAVSAALTAPVARSLGGRFSFQRSMFLTMLSVVVAAPLLALVALWDAVLPAHAVGLLPVLLLAQGPVLWFRDMALYGVSNPSQGRSVPAALVQPLAVLGGYALLVGFSPLSALVALLFLLLGWAAAVQVIRATDRPLRREFQASGVALLRPILDHIALRDPAATESLESFFSRFAIRSNLSAVLLEFRTAAGVKATVALPTVHPGPFAALGASNLPTRVADRLGPSSGLVLVPHTPCNHELDLPNARETDRVLGALAELRSRTAPGPSRASPLIAPRPDSLARAQRLGGATLVVVSQAPAPTDDIAYSVGDALRRRPAGAPGGRIALVDGHNSYVEDRGDISYGSLTAQRLAEDADAAIRAADLAAVDGPVEVGVAARTDLTIGGHGVGPAGIRALVVRAAGRTTAYLLIDGNNLVSGGRATILAAVRDLVDDAEVMTTDNHIVHEVDGSTNPVGGRYPPEALARDCRALVERARADLEPVGLADGGVEIPDIAVLGPSWTERLLTSLGDTVSVFGHQAATTLLLLLVLSFALLLAVR